MMEVVGYNKIVGVARVPWQEIMMEVNGYNKLVGVATCAMLKH